MGVFDTTYGAALDPTTMGLISAAAAGLQASGPSLMPHSLGQVVGAAGQGGIQGMQQAQLMRMEQQKADLLQQQVGQADFQQRMQQWALGGMQGQPPMPGAPSQPQSGQQPGQPQPGMMQAGNQPAQPGMQPTGAPGGFPAAGGPMAGVPDYLRTSAMLKTAGLPAMGDAVAKAGEPVIGREGGIYKRDAQGNLALDPGWMAGEKQRMELQKGIEDQHSIVDVPLANGQVQKMTKAQQLNLVGATNQISAAVPSLSKGAIADIQRQMIADPEKSVDLNITLGGRQAKLTIPALKDGMPGVTAGQSTEARSAQEKSGTNAGDVQSQIDTEAAGALQSRRILGEMKGLSQDFTQGKIAPFQRTLGEYAQALNLPGDWSKEIKAAESQQALQKLTAQMATAAMKQFTNRGTQMEFKTFLQNNPNAELTPGGFNKVLEFMDQASNASIQKQQAYLEWRKTNPLERSQDFLAEWNKKQNEQIDSPSGAKAPPKKGEVVDGWEFVGGDPGNRMNWKKK